MARMGRRGSSAGAVQRSSTVSQAGGPRLGDGAWTDRPEGILVPRALRHVEHTVELAGDARTEPRIRALVDEDRHGRRRGEKARIGEVCVSDVQRCTPATLRTFAMRWSFFR